MTPLEKVNIALDELNSEQPLGTPKTTHGAWREGKLTNRLWNNISLDLTALNVLKRGHT